MHKGQGPCILGEGGDVLCLRRILSAVHREWGERIHENTLLLCEKVGVALCRKN